ncbi:MAG: penicillin-binding protein [Actinomycetota bacterium]
MFSRTYSRRVIALGCALALTAAGCSQLSDLPRLTAADLRFHPHQSSFLYDSGGRLVTTFHGEENRTVIPLKRIPRHVRRAVIAIEDERFYEHDGVDLRAIARAFFANVRSGAVEEGGSTITQQYVKNVIISPGDIAARTIERKIDEAALARQLEEKLSKKEILARYLNAVYLGEGAYGIQASAKTFFGVPARKLSLAQGAVLAGSIRSPGFYNPFNKPRRALKRRNVVLEKMVQLGWVQPEKAQKAMDSKLGLADISDRNRYSAPYFVDYVKRLIKYDPRFKMLGRSPNIREKRMYTGGLSIYTTLDMDMQVAAEQAIQNVLSLPNDPHGALVAIEPDSGYVRAMVGGRDYFAKRKKDRYAKLNLAIVAEPHLGRVAVSGSKKVLKQAPGTGRQAGSAFKPFALLAALQAGKSLAERYPGPSVKVFPGLNNGAPWEVHNYADASFGTITLLEATINSVNTVYAQLIVDVGPENVVDVAEKMGIRTNLNPFFSAVLGSNEVNALGMASAFATLSSYGQYRAPVAITKIVNSRGRVIYENKPKATEAIEAGVAYIATTALQRVILEGTGTAAAGYLGGRPAAGKTGTAQEYQDAWFAGYTPDLAAAVWVGYPKGQIQMKPSCELRFEGVQGGQREVCRPTRVQVTGGSWPTEIWGAFMSRALAGVPVAQFDVPAAGLVAVTIDTRTGCLAASRTPDSHQSTQYFTPGTAPNQTCAVPGDDDGDGEVDTDDRTVPSVIGYERGAAVSLLEGKGFSVDVVQERESSGGSKKRSGEVWKQSPSGGTEFSRGATVTIWVNP